MPTVQGATRKETLRPLGVPKIAAPASNLAGDIGRVTEAAVGTTGRLEDAAVAEKNKVDKAMVLEADYNLSMLKSDLEVERNQLKGKGAAGAIDAIQEKYNLQAEEIGKGLANDAQKVAYSNRVKHHWAGPGGLYESTLKYTDSEIDKFSDANYNAVVDLRVDDAVEKSDEEAIFTQSLSELKAIIKDRNPDAAVAEQIYNKHLDAINAGIKEKRIETERALKIEADKINLEANNDLSDFFFNDVLSFGEINKREAALGADYERWVKLQKQSLETKEKQNETGKKVVDNTLVSATLAAEAMTMSPDVTTEDISDFKVRVAKEVIAGKLKPETGRSIIGDAERTLKLDPVRKSSEDNIVVFLKNDYNNGLYGEPGTPEARVEYNRQMTAFSTWSKANLDKDPVEYYERVSDIHKKGFIAGLLGIGEPEVTAKQRREEIEAEGKREQAINMLQDNNRPVTEANIQFIMGQI